MTTLDSPHSTASPRVDAAEPAEPGDPRSALRGELATLLDRDYGELSDRVRLVADLGLDSLAMMTLLTWLESRGVVLGNEQAGQASVGEVLALLDQARSAKVSIRVGRGAANPARPTDIAVAGSPDRRPDATLAPTLSNADIRLTPVTPDDVRFLYSLATHPDTCFRWRYRGVPPPLDHFVADLWTQVLIQFVARRNGDHEPVGHVVAYGADLGQGYAYLGAVFQPRYTGSGLAARGVSMFVRYLFHTYVLRKLYIEVPGFNWPQMRSGEGQLFQVEGVMRDHEHYAGRYWDRYLCAIYPEAV